MTDPTTRNYWNNFYKEGNGHRTPPSQFAAFVASEIPSSDMIVDIGCGNGRDSLFFASIGRKVLGMDQSVEAISTCNRSKARQAISDCEFIVGDLSSADTQIKLTEELRGASTPLFYARFFIHAITDEDEKTFLDFVNRHIGNGMLALEFRTKRDEALNKVTPGHFRRFVDPMAFAARARSHQLEVAYFIEGFGLAKYKHDDAHVARFLMQRSA